MTLNKFSVLSLNSSGDVSVDMTFVSLLLLGMDKVLKRGVVTFGLGHYILGVGQYL